MATNAELRAAYVAWAEKLKTRAAVLAAVAATKETNNGK